MTRPLSLRYYSERGDAIAKAAKQPHVVSVFVLALREQKLLPQASGSL